MAVNNEFSHFGVGSNKVAKVASDGLTHTATMQAGYSGTLQWQIDTGAGFINVAGETGTTFTPSPALEDGQEVGIVVTNISYSTSLIITTTTDATNPPEVNTTNYMVGSADNHILTSADNYTVGVQ